MKLFALAFAASLIAVPALACIPLTSSDGLSLTINRGGLIARFDYADLNTASRTKQAAELMEALQALMDDVRPIELIESIDPDKNFDPNRATLFWVDADGNRTSSILKATHVVSRCVLVTDVFWNGFDFWVSWQVVR
jgi:hypothetical protein